MGGRGSKSKPGGGGAESYLPPGAPTPENPGQVSVERQQEAKEAGFYYTRSDHFSGGEREAIPAPKGAPKFPLVNAERGTLVQIDGNPNKLAIVSQARANGNTKRAVVSTVMNPTKPGERRSTRGHFNIDRNRLKPVPGAPNAYAGGRRGPMAGWWAGKTDKIPTSE